MCQVGGKPTCILRKWLHVTVSSSFITYGRMCQVGGKPTCILCKWLHVTVSSSFITYGRSQMTSCDCKLKFYHLWPYVSSGGEAYLHSSQMTKHTRFNFFTQWWNYRKRSEGAGCQTTMLSGTPISCITAGGLDENEKFSKDWQSRFDGGPLDILNPKHAQYYKWWLIL